MFVVTNCKSILALQTQVILHACCIEVMLCKCLTNFGQQNVSFFSFENNFTVYYLVLPNFLVSFWVTNNSRIKHGVKKAHANIAYINRIWQQARHLFCIQNRETAKHYYYGLNLAQKNNLFNAFVICTFFSINPKKIELLTIIVIVY